VLARSLKITFWLTMAAHKAGHYASFKNSIMADETKLLNMAVDCFLSSLHNE
jgi:hypothetical protein